VAAALFSALNAVHNKRRRERCRPTETLPPANIIQEAQLDGGSSPKLKPKLDQATADFQEEYRHGMMIAVIT
jgi:hypothetical protein